LKDWNVVAQASSLLRLDHKDGGHALVASEFLDQVANLQMSFPPSRCLCCPKMDLILVRECTFRWVTLHGLRSAPKEFRVNLVDIGQALNVSRAVEGDDVRFALSGRKESEYLPVAGNNVVQIVIGHVRTQ